MTTDPLIGFQTSDLRFDRLIGRGAMGSVYQGVQLALNRTVAIKVIAAHLLDDPDHRARFDREARTLGRLVHPNIIACHDVGSHPGPDGRELFVMVLEFVDGWNLGALLKKDQLTVRRVLDLHRQAAEGLAYAHGMGIIHRDIKPDNIMVTKQGQGKLADFGLAKAEDSTLVTHTGVILGSPAYMSPEACQGQALSSLSDLYGLGCSLFHCLSGQPPFPASSSLQVLNLHVNAPVPLLSSRRPDLAMLDQVLIKLLAKDPKDRYQSGAILARDLKELTALVPGRSKAGHGQLTSMVNAPTVLSGGPVPPAATNRPAVTPTATIATAAPLAKPRRWPWIAGALMLAVVLLLVVDAVRSDKERQAGKASDQQAQLIAPYRKTVDEAEQSLIEGNIEDAEKLLRTFSDEEWPKSLQPRVDEIRVQIAFAWDERQRSIATRVEKLGQLIANNRMDEAKALVQELDDQGIPRRFSALRTDFEQAQRRLNAGGTVSGPRCETLSRPLEGLGRRLGTGDKEIPSPIPGGCTEILVSTAEKDLQRIAFPVATSKAGDGLALVVHAGKARDLRVMGQQAAGGRMECLATFKANGPEWTAHFIPLKMARPVVRLQLEADGETPFHVGRVVFGHGGVPTSEDLRVDGGTLRPVAVPSRLFPLSPRLWRISAHKVVLGVVGDQPPTKDDAALLADIDARFSPEEGDNLAASVARRVVHLKTAPIQDWLKVADKAQVLFLLLPPLDTREKAESWAKRLAPLLPAFRTAGTLVVPIVNAKGTGNDDLFAQPFTGEATLPIIDIDLVRSFLRRSGLLEPGRPLTGAQEKAGLLAGVAELRMRHSFLTSDANRPYLKMLEERRKKAP